jgi:hypothetical protein
MNKATCMTWLSALLKSIEKCFLVPFLSSENVVVQPVMPQLYSSLLFEPYKNSGEL